MDCVVFRGDGVHSAFFKKGPCSNPDNRNPGTCKCSDKFYEDDPSQPCISCFSPC